MHQIDWEKAKSEIAALLETALEGEEVIITQNDEPVLKLARVAQPRRKSGSSKGQIRMSENFDEPLDDFKEYMQ